MALGIPSHKVARTIHIKDAVAEGDIVSLEKLLKNYEGPTTLNNALRTASCKGYFEIVKLLVEHGASITTSKNMPIICAATNGHIDIVKYFLENGADCTTYEDKAFKQACKNGHIEVVKLLLERFYKNYYYRTHTFNEAITLASENGHAEIVKLIIENASGCTLRYAKPLELAIENGHLETIKVLDENTPNYYVSEFKKSIYIAATKGYTETIKYLLDKMPNDLLPGVFSSACKSGNIEFVKYVFEYGKKELSKNNPHICEGNSLISAIISGNIDVVKFLFEQDYDYTDELDVAIALAAEKGHLGIIELLVEKGGNCNASFKDKLQPTAIEAATQNNHLEAVVFLINHGAAKTPKQKVKLIEIAAKNGYMDIVEFLLNRVKKVNLNMAIKYATQNGHVEISNLLIRHTLIHTSKDFDAQIEMITKLTNDILNKR